MWSRALDARVEMSMSVRSRAAFLSDGLDRRVLVDGVRRIRRVMATGAMDEFRNSEMRPGPDCVVGGGRSVER